MTCRPPANRSTVATSAARTVVFETSTRASSSLTSAVCAKTVPYVFGDDSGARAITSGEWSFPPEVTVLHADSHAREAPQVRCELADEGHRSVFPPRAANGDRSVSLVLALIAGHDGLQ